MKEEKGITLITLTIYIIILTIVLELVALFNGNLFPQIKKLNNGNVSAEEFNKFNVSFVKDIKEAKTATVESSAHDVTITLSSGVHYYYVYNDEAIYREKVKIAKNISVFTANYSTQSSKNIIAIHIVTGHEEDKQFEKTINYVMNYWSK